MKNFQILNKSCCFQFFLIMLISVIFIPPVFGEVFELPVSGERIRYFYLPDKYINSKEISEKYIKFIKKLENNLIKEEKYIEMKLLKENPENLSNKRIMGVWLEKIENRRKLYLPFLDKLLEFNRINKEYSTSITIIFPIKNIYYKCAGKLIDSESSNYYEYILSRIREKFPDSWQTRISNYNINLSHNRIYNEKKAREEVKIIEVKIDEISKTGAVESFFDKERYTSSYLIKEKQFKKHLHEKNLLIMDLIVFCTNVASGQIIKPEKNKKLLFDLNFPENREYWYELAEKYCEKYLKTNIEEEMKNEILKLRNEFIPQSRREGKRNYHIMTGEIGTDILKSTITPSLKKQFERMIEIDNVDTKDEYEDDTENTPSKKQKIYCRNKKSRKFRLKEKIFSDFTINKLFNEEDWNDIEDLLNMYTKENMDEDFDRLVGELLNYFEKELNERNWFRFSNFLRKCEELKIDRHHDLVVKLINNPVYFRRGFFSVYDELISIGMKKELFHLTRNSILKMVFSKTGNTEKVYTQFDKNDRFLFQCGDYLRKSFYYNFNHLSAKDTEQLGLRVVNSENIRFKSKERFISGLFILKKESCITLLNIFLKSLEEKKDDYETNLLIEYIQSCLNHSKNRELNKIK